MSILKSLIENSFSTALPRLVAQTQIIHPPMQDIIQQAKQPRQHNIENTSKAISLTESKKFSRIIYYYILVKIFF